MVAPLTGVGLIAVEVAGIGLHNGSALEKNQSGQFRWHPFDKGLGFGESLAKACHYCHRVDGRIAGNAAKIGFRIAGDPSDFVDNPFGSEADGFPRRCLDGGSERQDPLVDRKQVDDVAGFPATVCGAHFVRR